KTPNPTASPSSSNPTLPNLTLTIIGSNGTQVSLSSTELTAITSVTSGGGYKTHDGISGVCNYTGAPVLTLCDLVGGIKSGDTLTVIASDGYTMTYTYEQVNGQGLSLFDSNINEATSTQPLTFIIAYYQDGSLLSDGGPLRSGFVTSESIFTTGNMWVKQVTTISIESSSATASPSPTSSASPSISNSPSPTSTTPSSSPSATISPTATPVLDWNLIINGTNQMNLSKTTFETQVGQNLVGWTDSSNSIWEGTPLYQIINWYVSSGGIDSNLLSLGYKVEVIASDGYSCTLNSSQIINNNNIFLSNKVNGTVLSGTIYPLALEGSDLAKREMVKGVVQIKITIALPEMSLTIVGPDGTEVILDAFGIAALEPFTETGGYNSHGTIKGIGEYTGIPIATLCNIVGAEISTKTMVHIEAGDGYTKDFTYEQLMGIEMTVYDPITGNITEQTQPLTFMIAYAMDGELLPEGHGPLQSAYVGSEEVVTISNLWVKNVVQIEIYLLA
ncbi:MAG: molybdopterin-dependent oxidoreductase, partial [Crenarchaeota archaeon]|nr:molybdopterin-dependent oxidoreductase [Thermoproteota archaeon]